MNSSDSEAVAQIKAAVQHQRAVLDLHGMLRDENSSGLAFLSKAADSGQLTALTELSLANNQLTSLPESLGQLTALTQLHLEDNQLTSVPESLGQLTALTQLRLEDNQLTSLPESLGQLTALIELRLEGNHLTSLPESLGQLTALTKLYLGGNQLTSLPESLGQLTALTTLGLTLNQLTSLPDFLGQLIALTYLGLRNNQLTSLPESLGQLTALIQLRLDGNQLTSLPESLGQLTALIELYLGDNQLTSLPEPLGQLTALTELHLGGNQLTSLPESLGQLTALTYLGLSNNQLTSLPESLGQLTALTQLRLANNQLTIPAEILQQSPQAVLAYYRSARESRALNEGKLILVGRGAVGKTSLVNRLVHSRFSRRERKTDGIKITDWVLDTEASDSPTLHVWDFGGQEIMHATHRFFLTERSLYLLVLSGREGNEDEDAEYWLQLIRSFGDDAPVIIVMNKIAQHPFTLNRPHLTTKYPNVRGFVETDCAEPRGIEELCKKIEEETERLDSIKAKFPSAWFDIKAQLGKTRRKFLTFDGFRKICRKHGEKDKQSQKDLARFLHLLGIALNYADDSRLSDKHVLNPRWVTQGIYKIINSDRLASQGGVLHLSDIGESLPATAYPQEMHSFLLDLMRKFELCFPFTGSDTKFLVPELLGKEEPPEVQEFVAEECLNFRYRYQVLPEGILPRFIVRSHSLSEDSPRWHTGVLLRFEGCEALVKADTAAKVVQISVRGSQELRRRELLAVIRSDFERIHGDIVRLDPEELVPVPGAPDVALSYNDLRVMEEQGRRQVSVVVNGTVRDLPVRDLLGGIDVDRRRESLVEFSTRRPRDSHDEKEPAAKVFVSYSHKDESLRNDLETHLKLLERRGLIEVWNDRLIPPGNEWQPSIDDHLERADVILFLVSVDFLASDYIDNVEMTRALERHHSGEATVIPIIVRDVNWKQAPFAKLQALPKDGKPVRNWGNKDRAWRSVAEGIETVILDWIRNKQKR